MLALFLNNFGLKHISDDAFLTFVGTIGAVMNGLSRSFWGFLIDHLPYKYVYGSLLFTQMVIGFTFQFIVPYQYLYLVWISISYFCLGGHFSITPAV
mmetsp:Transcript_12078/g.10677  ORF Transcript_12078/g.10677 Transcript_12078/m.10677 type:complete len:97 (+) Transcript_12078:932-1222(+)